MATLGDLVVNLAMDTSRYSAGVADARGGTASLRQHVDGLTGGLGGLVSRLRGMAASLVLLAGIGSVGATLFSSVALAAEAERAQVAFSTLTGSAENAKATLGELNDFAASTPFELGELKESAQKLLAFGSGRGELIGEMRMLGDIASGTGSRLGELTAIYGKVRATGVLSLEQVNQFAERGVPIYKALADTLGVSQSQIRSLASTGKIGFEGLRAALESTTAAGAVFGGGMEAQSRTLGGLWSTLKDNVTAVLTQIGEKIVSTFDLKGILGSAIDWVGAFARVLGKVLEAIGPLAKILVGVAIALGVVAAAAVAYAAAQKLATIAAILFQAVTNPAGLALIAAGLVVAVGLIAAIGAEYASAAEEATKAAAASNAANDAAKAGGAPAAAAAGAPAARPVDPRYAAAAEAAKRASASAAAALANAVAEARRASAAADAAPSGAAHAAAAEEAKRAAAAALAAQSAAAAAAVEEVKRVGEAWAAARSSDVGVRTTAAYAAVPPDVLAKGELVGWLSDSEGKAEVLNSKLRIIRDRLEELRPYQGTAIGEKQAQPFFEGLDGLVQFKREASETERTVTQLTNALRKVGQMAADVGDAKSSELQASIKGEIARVTGVTAQIDAARDKLLQVRGLSDPGFAEYKAHQAGALQEQTHELRKVLEELDLATRQKAGRERAGAATADMRQEIGLLNGSISETDKLLAGLKIEGLVNQQTIADVRKLSEELAKAKENSKLKETADKLAEQFRTPAEVLSDRIAELDELASKGLIDSGTYARARGEAERTAAGPGTNEGPRALQRGSQEAFAAISARIRGDADQAARRTADNTARANELLGELSVKLGDVIAGDGAGVQFGESLA